MVLVGQFLNIPRPSVWPWWKAGAPISFAAARRRREDSLHACDSQLISFQSDQFFRTAGPLTNWTHCLRRCGRAAHLNYAGAEGTGRAPRHKGLSLFGRRPHWQILGFTRFRLNETKQTFGLEGARDSSSLLPLVFSVALSPWAARQSQPPWSNCTFSSYPPRQ